MTSQNRSPQPTKRPLERSNRFTTLPPLLRHFKDLPLQVELKNGQTYNGTLHEADDYMNLVLKRASPGNIGKNDDDGNLPQHHSLSASLFPNKRLTTLTTLTTSNEGDDANGSLDPSSLDPSPLDPIYYQLLHLRGPSIRYIHFPSNVDLPILIKLGLDRERSAQNKYKRGKRK